MGGDAPFADGNASFAGGDVLFMDGNAAARTFGRAHRHRPYHSKHTSPFRKGENRKFGARSNAASAETQKTMLAVTLQALKSKITTIKEQCFLFGSAGFSVN